jgi:hypothetical protein
MAAKDPITGLLPLHVKTEREDLVATLEVPGVGPLLLAVSLAADDQQAAAVRNAQKATIEATDTQRNANVIHLRKFAAKADSELGPKIEVLINVYQNPPPTLRQTEDGGSKIMSAPNSSRKVLQTPPQLDGAQQLCLAQPASASPVLPADNEGFLIRFR